MMEEIWKDRLFDFIKVVITFDDTQVVEAWESRRECHKLSRLLTYKAQRNSQDLGGAAHTIIM